MDIVVVWKCVRLPVAVSFLALVVLRRVLGFYGGLTLALTTRDQDFHKIITYWPLRGLIDELLVQSHVSWVRKKCVA